MSKSLIASKIYLTRFFIIYLPLIILQSCTAAFEPQHDITDRTSNQLYEQYVHEGLGLFSKGDTLGGLAVLEKAIPLNPHDQSVIGLVAVKYLSLATSDTPNRRQRAEMALLYANMLLKIDPENPEAYYVLATLDLMQGKFNEAMQHYLVYVNSPTKSKTGSNIPSDKSIGSVYGLLGYLYGMKQDYENSLDCLKKFISRCDNDPLYAQRMKRAKDTVAKLETYFRYKSMYDTSQHSKDISSDTRQSTEVNPPHKASISPNATQKQTEKQPPASSRPEQKPTNVQHIYQQLKEAKQDLDREIQERARQLSIVTG